VSPFEQNLFDHVAELTELYLRNEISDEQMAQLETLVLEDEQAADAMRTVMQQAGMMRAIFDEQQQFAHRIGEVDRNEYLKLLQALSPTEEPEPVHLVGQINIARPIWQQWQFVIPSGIAALLAIAVTLIITLSGSTPAPTPAPHASDHPKTPRGSTVATLTAEHDAVWSLNPGESLRPGSALASGQRLTLTTGLAEITTNDGAIAILEAPASIEMLDNENAIRLHAGKLVGICETESSKGFLVRTPHLHITDLGTRFGVDADANTTEVHVFEGEVQAERVDAAPASQPITLVANQSARTLADTDTITRIDHDADRFAAVNHDGSLNRSVLLARTDAGLDIVDIIAGGDGRGASRMRGIHPQTGEQNAEPILDYSASFLDSHGGYRPVQANPFIDGIFIPHTTEEVQVDSSGRTVSSLDVSTPRSFQLLWAGGLMPLAGSQDVVEGVARMYPEQPQQAPVLYFISNKGVTLDLDSLREHHGVRGTLTFRTLVQSMASLENSRSGTADFLCLVDGNEVAEIRDMKQGSDPTPIAFRIEPTQRFLTLIVTDSGDQLHSDWVVLDRPVLEPEAAN
jgi:hypothetical protein